MHDLLSLVPSKEAKGKSLLDEIHEFNEKEAPQEEATTRLLGQGPQGLEKLDTSRLSMGIKDRMDLIMIMLEGEKTLGKKKVNDIFGGDFFNTKFWTVWSTTFAFQPWHSAAEFRRYLIRFVHDVRNLNNPKTLDRTRYNQHDSIITPVYEFLKNEGVDFRFNTRVTDVMTYPESDPTTVSEIKMEQNGSEKIVTLDPNDLLIMTLGSITSGTVTGTNTTPPAPSKMEGKEDLDQYWMLWMELAKKNLKFGNPSNFSNRVPESRLESFTMTLKDPEFFDRFTKLTHDRPGTGALVTLKDTPWQLSLNLPHQPLFPKQPQNVQVAWGYALTPEREGKFVKKSMLSCSGQEIMKELLQHLDFPQDSILKNSITIPCVMPRVAAELVTRAHGDRPEVIPRNMTNLGLVGQFVEIPDDTTFTMEYSVRGAQTAVHRLMELDKEPPKPQKSSIAEFLEILV